MIRKNTANIWIHHMKLVGLNIERLWELTYLSDVQIKKYLLNPISCVSKCLVPCDKGDSEH